MIFIYDCEVFAHDWVVVFKNVSTGEHTVIYNDNDALRAMFDEDNIYIGFNSKHYDTFIVKGTLRSTTGDAKWRNSPILFASEPACTAINRR